MKESDTFTDRVRVIFAGAEDFEISLLEAKSENMDLIVQIQANKDYINGLGAELNHHRFESSAKTSEIMRLSSTLAAKEQWISHQNVQIEDLKGRVFTFAANAAAADTKPDDH